MRLPPVRRLAPLGQQRRHPAVLDRGHPAVLQAIDGRRFGQPRRLRPVEGGDTVTFDFLGTRGVGTPRVYLQFDGGASAGENTFDTGMCTQVTANTGTVTYTIMKSGTITAFAEIHDSDNGQTTYSNLVIAGIRINF